MIATVTLNPALDKTVYLDRLQIGDTNRIIKVETDAGGKGINASRMLRELGAPTLALGFLGGRTGSFIQHVLEREGVETDFVWIKRETRTNIQIQTADGAPPTALNERGGPVTEDELGRLVERVQAAADRCHFFIFGGSVPDGVPTDVYDRLIEAIEAKGGRAVLDTEGDLLQQGLKATPFMIKPNREEAQRLVNRPLETRKDIAEASEGLHERGIELVVISLGKDGAIAASSDGLWEAVPPEVPVLSTVGSGDSMVAGIVLALSQGQAIEDALRLGSACGAATAMSSGVAMGRREDVMCILPNVRVRRLDCNR